MRNFSWSGLLLASERKSLEEKSADEGGKVVSLRRVDCVVRFARVEVRVLSRWEEVGIVNGDSPWDGEVSLGFQWSAVRDGCLLS